MQNLFEFCYVLSHEEDARKMFINVTIGKMDDEKIATDHLFQVSMVYGTMQEGQEAVPIAQIVHAIVSDDRGMAGVGDEKGSTDLPVFLIYSQSNMNGRLEGVNDIHLISRMGDDVVDVTTVLGDVTSSLNFSHKAFMLNALSLHEQLNADSPIENFAEYVSEAELLDIIDTFVTFYIASLHEDQEQARPFIDFLARAKAYAPKEEGKVTMKVLD